MLLSSKKGITLNIITLAKIVKDVNITKYIGETTAVLNVSRACIHDFTRERERGQLEKQLYKITQIRNMWKDKKLTRNESGCA